MLWAYKAYRTTSRSSIGKTTFYLVYGLEAVILMEIREITLQVRRYEKNINDEGRSFDFDVIGEKKETV